VVRDECGIRRRRDERGVAAIDLLQVGFDAQRERRGIGNQLCGRDRLGLGTRGDSGERLPDG
jgi:hypothetical protein